MAQLSNFQKEFLVANQYIFEKTPKDIIDTETDIVNEICEIFQVECPYREMRGGKKTVDTKFYRWVLNQKKKPGFNIELKESEMKTKIVRSKKQVQIIDRVSTVSNKKPPKDAKRLFKSINDIVEMPKHEYHVITEESKIINQEITKIYQKINFKSEWATKAEKRLHTQLAAIKLLTKNVKNEHKRDSVYLEREIATSKKMNEDHIKLLSGFLNTYQAEAFKRLKELQSNENFFVMDEYKSFVRGTLKEMVDIVRQINSFKKSSIEIYESKYSIRGKQMNELMSLLEAPLKLQLQLRGIIENEKQLYEMGAVDNIASDQEMDTQIDNMYKEIATEEYLKQNPDKVLEIITNLDVNNVNNISTAEI